MGKYSITLNGVEYPFDNLAKIFNALKANFIKVWEYKPFESKEVPKSNLTTRFNKIAPR